MKKFVFPLEKVLNYKTAVLDDEKGKLAVLRQELHRIEAEIEENRRQLFENDLHMRETAAKGTSLFELQSMNFQIENTRRHIDGLELSRAVQQRKVDRQLNVVLQATQDVNGLERLKEKQLAEHTEAVRKEENLIISELVGSQYVRELEGIQ